jgi:hypothetical protein
MNGSDEGFGVIEADFLYGLIRKHQPAKILQVGCGVDRGMSYGLQRRGLQAGNHLHRTPPDGLSH